MQQKNMNKLTAFCFFFLLTGSAHLCTAQTSVNKIRITGGSATVSPAFIAGISFTPDGILQNTGGGSAKSIKINPAPVIVKDKVSPIVTSEEPNTVIEKLAAIQFKYAMVLDVAVESLKKM